MGIVGLGTDIVDVARLTRLMHRSGPRFVERWFRASELTVPVGGTESAQIATLMAIKESTAKALRVPKDAPAPWRDIEIIPGPGLRVHSRMQVLAAERGARAFRLSMTQTPDHAMAVVVALSTADQAPL